MARSGAALLLLLFCCVASGVYEDSPDSRKLFGGYRIVPKPCRPDAGGDDLGICMFNYECSARDGVVAGACMDGFLFGACCRLPPGHTFELPDADLLTEDASTFPPENPNAISATSRRPDQVSDLLNDPQLHVSAHPDADTVLLTGPATSRPELSTFSYVESNGVEEHTSTPKYHTAAITPTYYSTVSKWSRPTAEYDEGLVLVPTITKRPEPGPNPESINHIISLLNDSSPGLVDPGPEPEPGLSTWVAVNADPTSYPSTSSHHVAGPSYEVVTTEQGTTRPVPTVIVLGPLSSDATTSRPSLITSSKLSSTVPTLVTKRPSSTGFFITKRPSSTTATNRPSTHFSRPTEATNRPSTYFSRPTETIYRPSTHFSRPTEATNRPSTHFVRPTEATYRPFTHFTRPTETTSRPSTHFSRPTEATNWHSTHFSRPTETTNRPSTHFSRPTEATNRPSTHFSRPTEATNRPSTQFNRPTEATNRPSTHFNRPTESTNRPPTLYTKRPTEVTYFTNRPLTGITHVTNRPGTGTIFVTERPSFTNRPTSGTTLVSNQPWVTTPIDYPDTTSGVDSLANFPPVRNPSFNMTQHERPPVVLPPNPEDLFNVDDIPTPTFIEDDKLNSNLQSFVDKIVQSLDGNFHDLEEVLYAGKNTTSTTTTITTTTRRPVTSKRPTSTTSPKPTRRPTPTGSTPVRRTTTSPTSALLTSRPTRPPQTSLRPRPSTPRPSRPSTQATKPSQRPSTQTTRPSQRPSTQTTRPSQRPSTQSTRPSQRPTAQSTRPSQKPITQSTRPSQRPTTQTTRPSQRPKPSRPSTTLRPTSPVKATTTKRSTTTSSTTQLLIQQDETIKTTTTEEPTTLTTTAEELALPTKPVDYKHECGVRPLMQKKGRIVGGKSSTFGEWPWQVLVRESTWLGLFTKNKCGGVLITSRYVITAAHCQPGFLANLVAVLGEFDISGELESRRSVTKNVRRVVVHRQYDAATFANDLALLELESPVAFDEHIVPICMPRDKEDFTGRMATVTGWGRLKYGGGVPNLLQEVQVPVIENSVCQEMFHTAGHSKVILNSFMCAGYANGQKDSCEVIFRTGCSWFSHLRTIRRRENQEHPVLKITYNRLKLVNNKGDSGGPLMLEREDGRWVLVGTVSHGIKCAAPYLPGVYMRTTYYKPWLHAITGVN